MKKTVLVSLMLVLLLSGYSYSSGFFNLGEYEKNPSFFFSGAYYYSSRNIILGTQTDVAYVLEYLSYDAYMGFAVSDSLSLYGGAAFTDFNLQDNIDGEYDMKLTGGLRLTIFEIVKIALKAGESESRTFDLSFVSDFKISYFKSNGTTVMDSVAIEVDWLEYQVALAMAVNIDPFRFYLGPKFSFIEGNFNPAFAEQLTFSNDGFFSLFIGSSYDLSKGVRLQAEASIFAETSIGANLQFYF
jgi:hypothetical protein